MNSEVLLLLSCLTRISTLPAFFNGEKRYFKCFKDLCTNDEQFCNWQEQRCKNCEDFSDNCGKREQPHNCSVFCGKFLIQQTLTKISEQTVHPTTLSTTTATTTKEQTTQPTTLSTTTATTTKERTEERVPDKNHFIGIGIAVGIVLTVPIFFLCYIFVRKFRNKSRNVTDRTSNAGQKPQETFPLQRNEPDNGNEEHEPVQVPNEPWQAVIPTSEDTDYNLVPG